MENIWGVSSDLTLDCIAGFNVEEESEVVRIVENRETD